MLTFWDRGYARKFINHLDPNSDFDEMQVESGDEKTPYVIKDKPKYRQEKLVKNAMTSVFWGRTK